MLGEPIPDAPEAVDQLALINLLMAQVAQLQASIAAGKKVEVLGPPPMARKDLKHIMVFVSADTSVRTEVTDEYIKELEASGWRGEPIKGYANHENTLHRR